jgi:hypothetical protein
MSGVGTDVEVAVVLPALNEEQALPGVLGALRRLADSPLTVSPEGARARIGRVVVVDNGSTDATAAVAAAAGAVVVREPERGYGRACLAGLAALGPSPPAIVAFLDADASDDPGMLRNLVRPLVSGDADLVLGSRRLGRLEPGAMPAQARWGNRLAVTMIRLLYGFRYTDLGPFRAVRFEALASLGMRDPTFGWTVEMQVKALRAGWRVLEIAVPYRTRVGTSKISGTLSGSVKAGAKILWTIARLRFQARRVTPARGPS